MIAGLLLTSFLNENKYEFIIIIITFIILTIVHVIANYYAVKSLELKTLNRERLNIVITDYLKEKNNLSILSPKQVRQFENVWNVNLFPFNYFTDLLFKTNKDKMILLNLGIKINCISSVWMKWNLDNKFKKYYFNVTKEKNKNIYYVNVAYNIEANDVDFLESFLISKIIKDWIWNEMKIKPNSKLQSSLPSERKLKEFSELFTNNSIWYIANLRYSLCIMPNRFSIS